MIRLIFASIATLMVGASVVCADPSTKQGFVSINGIKIQVELARTESEWMRGLMFRDRLGPREGMLFLGYSERPQSFWMKNTPLSLDIIFISSKKNIVSIQKRTTPFSLEPLPSKAPAQYVLEILGGQSDALGIKEGMKVEFVHIEPVKDVRKKK